MAINIVELAAPADECAFNQRCKFGHLVEGHAVYCHNDAWYDGPRKCRRSWYTDGEIKDEDCPGFQPNPAFKEALAPTPIPQPYCTQCKGSRLVKTDGKQFETCRHCMGSGSEPQAIPLTTYQKDTLELGLSFSGKHSGLNEWYVRMVENQEEADALSDLWNSHLIEVRSISAAKGVSAYLIRLTGKGEATLRAVWEKNKEA